MIVKYKISTFFILLCLSLTAHAKTVYITDKTKHMLRDQGSKQGNIINMLPAGTALDVISEDLITGFLNVRTKKGIEGYILATNTLDRPSRAWYLRQTRKKLDALKQSYALQTQELNEIKNNKKDTVASNAKLNLDYEKLSKKFADLRKASANPVEIKLQRDKLQARVIAVERELQQVKHQNQILQGNTDHEWFIYGGILTLFSVLVGYLLSKLNWQRKSSNWDTF